MPQFMVLMRENDDAWSGYSPDEQQALLAKYQAWVDAMRAADQLRDGNPLGSGGRLLRMTDGEIVDGPFTETKEVLTGYFVIEAADWDAAVQIAKGCPALTHGETVELRSIGHD